MGDPLPWEPRPLDAAEVVGLEADVADLWGLLTGHGKE